MTTKTWKSIQDTLPRNNQFVIVATIMGSLSREPRLIQWDTERHTDYFLRNLPDLHWTAVPRLPAKTKLFKDDNSD